MLTRLISTLNRPFLFLHEVAHYTAARALGMAATRHPSHTTFHPDEGDNAAILAVLLAPCAVSLTLLLITVALLLIAPQWWIIPVHTGLLGLCLLIGSISDLHSVYLFLRRGAWPIIDNPEQLDTVGEWLGRRLRSRI